jgi:hypothetical protein
VATVTTLPRNHDGTVDVDRLWPAQRTAYEAGRLDERVACLEDTAAADRIGHARGFAEGQMQASEDLAQQWLHRLAFEHTRAAVTTARTNHGPAWADAIAEAAQPPAAPLPRRTMRGTAA